MKSIKTALVAFACIGFMSLAHAEESKDHSAHHPEGQQTENKSDSGDMMGTMDMQSMHGMMQECMAMHKDGKMCDHDMMAKCQKQMGKGECQKMMKKAKAKKK